jgi:CHAD domain-containing protein
MPEALDVLAKDAAFSSDDLLADAARRIMAKHTRKLYNHLPGVLSGNDPHDIHQARVATRRLRACLEATSPAFKAKPVTALRQQLRGLARALGEVRDRDVLAMRLRTDADRYPAEERTPLLDVVRQVDAERSVAHKALLRELSRKRTTRLLQQLNDFLLCPLEKVQSRSALPLLVRHYAGSAMLRRYEEVRHFEALIGNATSEQLHDLRIACKHLRYTLELFEPALPDAAQAVTKLVTDMQEHLGDLHDADVALVYLGVDPAALEQEHEIAVAQTSSDGAAPEPAHDALHAYIMRRRKQRAQLIEGVTPLWDELVDLTIRRELASAIAML